MILKTFRNVRRRPDVGLTGSPEWTDNVLWVCLFFGLNVLKAERCSSRDALSTSDHSVERFPVLGVAVAVPGSDASRDDRLDSSREVSLQPLRHLR